MVHHPSIRGVLPESKEQEVDGAYELYMNIKFVRDKTPFGRRWSRQKDPSD